MQNTIEEDGINVGWQIIAKEVGTQKSMRSESPASRTRRAAISATAGRSVETTRVVIVLLANAITNAPYPPPS